MSFEEKKVLVVGTGKSGVAATGLLLKEKVQTVLFDADKELDTKAFFEKNPSLNGEIGRASCRERVYVLV